MSQNKPDFGYLGKGVTGYAHYRRVINRTFPAGKEPYDTGDHIQYTVSIQPTPGQPQPSQTKNAPLMKFFYWVGLAIAIAFFCCIGYLCIAPFL